VKQKSIITESPESSTQRPDPISLDSEIMDDFFEDRLDFPDLEEDRDCLDFVDFPDSDLPDPPDLTLSLALLPWLKQQIRSFQIAVSAVQTVM
jgi:hypothetical protein